MSDLKRDRQASGINKNKIVFRGRENVQDQKSVPCRFGNYQPYL